MSRDIQPSREKGFKVTRADGYRAFMEAGNVR